MKTYRVRIRAFGEVLIKAKDEAEADELAYHVPWEKIDWIDMETSDELPQKVQDVGL